MAPTARLQAQGSWEKIPVPTSKTLNSVFFTDSVTGWVAGDSGTILHTVDGGKNWVRQQTHTTNEVLGLFFLDRNHGWASSFNYKKEPFGTLMLKTNDGGNTWDTSTYPQNDIFIYSIYYFDSLNGWMGGRPHALVKTTDGGKHWTQAAIDTSTLAFFPVEYITFWNRKHGYASGGIFDVAGVIWSTHDYGEHWKAIDGSQAPADEVHALHCFDSTHVIGAGGDPDFGYGVGMIRTADGGAAWTYQELSMQGNARDLAFRTGRECWAPLGARQRMIYSLDTGYTWTEIPAPESSVIMRICFPDSLHGYGVGKNGTFIRYKPHASGIAETAPGITLAGPYPNPCGDEAWIRISLPFETRRTSCRFSVRIFSAMGYEVNAVHEMLSEPGQTRVRIQTNNLQAGVYFIRISDIGREGSVTPIGVMKLVRGD